MCPFYVHTPKNKCNYLKQFLLSVRDVCGCEELFLRPALVVCSRVSITAAAKSLISDRVERTFSEFFTFTVNFLQKFPVTRKNALSRVVLLVCVCDGNLSPLLEGVFIREGVWKRSIKAPSFPVSGVPAGAGTGAHA